MVRTSTIFPARAAAAAMIGLTSSVRPVGEPWRPLKLRLEVEAQIWRPESLSGFIARHMEQPAWRHSKPASAKTLSRPSASAAFCTFCEPGTASARTPGATRFPFTISAAARRSPRRPFVHEPMKTTSTGVPSIF